jgi:hypothetical protein
MPISSLGEQGLPTSPLSLLSQACLVKYPLTQALCAALSAPYQVNNARRHDLLWEMSLCNFDASYTSSSAADMAFISCGSNTLSRKPMPSPKNGMIVPICGYRFSFVPEMQTPVSRLQFIRISVELSRRVRVAAEREGQAPTYSNAMGSRGRCYE